MGTYLYIAFTSNFKAVADLRFNHIYKYVHASSFHI